MGKNIFAKIVQGLFSGSDFEECTNSDFIFFVACMQGVRTNARIESIIKGLKYDL